MVNQVMHRSELGLFQQATNSDWPHLFYSAAYIFTCIWWVAGTNFGVMIEKLQKC